MGLLDRFKKWFFKEENVGIINIGDLIQIPGREYFKDDTDKLDLIDKYKEEYLSKLNSKNTLYSGDLSTGDLQSELLMNVDLVFYHVLKENNFSELASEELVVQMTKLKLYLKKMNKLENETIIRLIALKELEKGRIVPHKNRNALKEQINILTTNLIIFMNQKRAIEIEVNAYLTTINIGTADVDVDLINKRYDKLIEISSTLIGNKAFDIIYQIESKVLRISEIERELEIYVYKNKSEINLLHERLKKLDQKAKTKENKNELLHELSFLEQKYIVFYEYGKNVVTEEEMLNLYRIKFDILTCDIDYLRESPINEEEYGYHYYREIIFKKIERILKGENIYIDETFKDSAVDAIKIIREYFKDENGEFDLDKILTDKYLLNLLCSFDKEHGFKDMVTNNVLYPQQSYKDANMYERMLLDQKGIEWSTCVPFESLLSIISEETAKEDEVKYGIYILYKLMNKIEDSRNSTYSLPYGIKSINTSDMLEETKELIRKKSKRKVLLMPSTLISLSGNLFNDDYPKVVLNDGLEVIGKYAFYHLNSSYLTIPSSVRKIDKMAFDTTRVLTINFEDYENSKLLNSETEFAAFIKMMFYKKQVERKLEGFEGIKIERPSDVADLSEEALGAIISSKWTYEILVTPIFDEIRFNNSFGICRKDLSYTYYDKFWKRHLYDKTVLNQQEANNIIAKIRRKIKIHNDVVETANAVTETLNHLKGLSKDKK